MKYSCILKDYLVFTLSLAWKTLVLILIEATFSGYPNFCSPEKEILRFKKKFQLISSHNSLLLLPPGSLTSLLHVFKTLCFLF